MSGVAATGVVALVATAVVLRAVVLASPAGRLDSDEAVVALMALRMRGGHFELFYSGQHYGGVVEPLVVAFAVTLHRSVLFVKLVPLALSAIAAWVVARAGRRLFRGDVDRARLAGALCFAWPGTVWLATKERGFYWVTAVLVAVAFLLVLRIRDQGAIAARRECVALGLVTGLAWYETAQSAFVLVPLMVWFVLALRLDRGAAVRLAGGALIGAAPWIAGLVRDGRDVLAQPDYHLGYTGRLRVVFAQLLPRIAGLRGTYRGGWLLAGAGLIVWCASVAAFAVVLTRLLRTTGRRTDGMVAVVLIVLAFAFVAAIARATWYAAEPRYALTLVPFLALLVASALTTPARACAAVVAVIVLSAANVASVVASATAARPAVDLAPPRVAGLARALDAASATRVYADYWIAYALTFETGDRIVAAPLDRPRSVAIQRSVTTARARTWVLYSDSPRDRALPRELTALGVPFTRVTVGAFVEYRLARFIDPRTIPPFWRSVHAGR